MWHFDLTALDTNNVTTVDCAGSVAIRNQVGSTFNGSYLIEDLNCGTLTGSVVDGTLANDGRVSFGLTFAGGTDPNFLVAAFGCTYAGGDTRVSGTIVGTQLQAASTTLLNNCANGVGRASMSLRLAGSR